MNKLSKDSQRPPVFLLFGMGGLFNYGCEAIARGTEIIIRKIYPSAVIRYASYYPDIDRRRLAGSSIEVVPRPRVFRRNWRRIVGAFLKKLAPGILFNQEDLRCLRDVDVVLSVGGDLYTMNTAGSIPRGLMAFGEVASKHGKKYVLWGASVGPFSSNPAAEALIIGHLRRMTHTTVRESFSLLYLQEHGVRNCSLFPDPAFFVAPEMVRDPVRDGVNKILGVNLSPLSLRYAGLDLDLELGRQADALVALVEKFGLSLKLLPHVVCSDSEGDDDLRYLRKLHALLSSRLGGRVEIVDNDPGFVGIKRHLLGCDALIATRMHCAVNALSAAVPTILLSYSAKAKGMSDFVYGSQDYCVPVNELISQKFIAVFEKFWENRGNLNCLLSERKRFILLQADQAMTCWNFLDKDSL